MKGIPLYTLDSYKLVKGIHGIILGLDELEPYILIHHTSGDVHYHFEGSDKDQVIFICKKIRIARSMAIEGFIELGYTPAHTDLKLKESS